MALSIALLPALPAVGGGASPLLVITSLAGNIGVVPVTGGDVVWVSSPCGPGGGCSFVAPCRSMCPSGAKVACYASSERARAAKMAG